MKAVYVNRGEAIDFVNDSGADIAAGEVVSLGIRIGVAGGNIPNGEPGALHVTGVFELPKAAEELALGAAVYYAGDGVTAAASTGSGNSAAENVPAGWVVKAAAADDATVRVKIG